MRGLGDLLRRGSGASGRGWSGEEGEKELEAWVPGSEARWFRSERIQKLECQMVHMRENERFGINLFGGDEYIIESIHVMESTKSVF